MEFQATDDLALILNAILPVTLSVIIALDAFVVNRRNRTIDGGEALKARMLQRLIDVARTGRIAEDDLQDVFHETLVGDIERVVQLVVVAELPIEPGHPYLLMLSLITVLLLLVRVAQARRPWSCYWR